MRIVIAVVFMCLITFGQILQARDKVPVGSCVFDESGWCANDATIHGPGGGQRK